MNHTKGEWIATRGSHSYPLEITTETKTIAQIETRWKIEETDANARLIAAAPDLLAACELAEKAFISHSEYEVLRARRACIAAITKAEQ